MFDGGNGQFDLRIDRMRFHFCKAHFGVLQRGGVWIGILTGGECQTIRCVEGSIHTGYKTVLMRSQIRYNMW